MADAPTAKDYIDARTDAVRAQNDARFAEMMSEMRSIRSDLSERLSNISAEQHVQNSKIETLSTSVVGAMSDVRASMSIMRGEMADTQRIAKESALEAKSASDRAVTAAAGTKWNIIVTAIAVAGVMAAMFAIYIGAVQMTIGLVGK